MEEDGREKGYEAKEDLCVDTILGGRRGNT